MNRITWYIFRQLLGPLAFVTITLTGVVWLTQSLRFMDLMINRGLSGTTLLYLTLLLLPHFLVLILPISIFCSVLFVYFRLESDSELVVMSSTGISSWKLTQPAIQLGLLITIILFTLTLYFQPLGFRTFKDKQFTFRHNLAPVIGQEGVFNNIINGVTVFVRERGPNGELKGLLVHDERDLQRPISMIAKEGSFAILNDKPRFILENGTRQEFRRDSNQLSLLYFDRYIVNLERITPKPQERWREGSERFLSELFDPGSKPDDIKNAKKLNSEGHRRIISPFYALALAMIAAAAIISSNKNRKNKWLIPVFSGFCAILFELVGIGIFSIIPKTPQLTPLVYLHVVVTLIICVLIILRNPKLSLKNS